MEENGYKEGKGRSEDRTVRPSYGKMGDDPQSKTHEEGNSPKNKIRKNPETEGGRAGCREKNKELNKESCRQGGSGERAEKKRGNSLIA